MANQTTYTDPFDEIRKAVNEHSGEIIRRIYGIEKNVPVFLDTYGQSRIRGGNGKTTVAKCVGTYRVGSESAEPLQSMEIYIKVYRGINGNGKKNEEIDYMERPREPWKNEAEVYKLFEQSGFVPKAFLFSDIPGLEDKLITLSAGDQTLEQRLIEIDLKNKKLIDEELAELQLPLFSNVTCAQASFDNYAENEILPSLIGGDKRLSLNLKVSREVDVLNKSLNYLRAWLGKDEIDNIPPETIAEFEEYYKPIAVRFEKNRKKLIHGALDGENIVSRRKEGWKAPDIATRDSGNIKLIDLESLRFGHPFFDLSFIATTPGSYLGPRQWEEIIKHYNEVRLKLLGFEPEEKKSYVVANFFKRGKKGDAEIKINENFWKGMRSVFYAGVIHNLFKIGAKLKDREKFFPDSFEAMIQERPYLKSVHEHNRRFIAKGIEAILENPESFVINGQSFYSDAFTNEEIKKIEGLSNFFIKQGVIMSDRCPLSRMEKSIEERSDWTSQKIPQKEIEGRHDWPSPNHPAKEIKDHNKAEKEPA